MSHRLRLCRLATSRLELRLFGRHRHRSQLMELAPCCKLRLEYLRRDHDLSSLQRNLRDSRYPHGQRLAPSPRMEVYQHSLQPLQREL